MRLIHPTRAHLPPYVAALQRGWSADNVRGAAAAAEELQKIADDPDGFLASHEDPQAAAGPITLPDGRVVARLPGIRRWIWDGDDFCGSIGLRWPADLGPLPPHVLGHIGYAVVPWHRGRGLATRALGLMLIEAHLRGLRRVELTTDPDNLASQKVILAQGGVLQDRFVKDAAYGGAEGLRYAIAWGDAGPVVA